MKYRCYLTSCPHFVAPCEFDISQAPKCPIGEVTEESFYTTSLNEFFSLIVGSRSFTDYHKFYSIMETLLQKKRDEGKEIFIVSGGANGTDSMAERYAKEKSYRLYVVKADWSKGKKAGFLRNEEMHRFISEQKERGCVAFWDGKSPGTAQSFELAKKYNNQIRKILV